MPPKKIAVKGAKGKAKAASKEEKKQSKSPKPVDKGKFQVPNWNLSLCILRVVNPA